MDENFLLQTETAQKLYHEHAAKMPIFDYHCHISPKEIELVVGKVKAAQVIKGLEN